MFLRRCWHFRVNMRHFFSLTNVDLFLTALWPCCVDVLRYMPENLEMYISVALNLLFKAVCWSCRFTQTIKVAKFKQQRGNTLALPVIWKGLCTSLDLVNEMIDPFKSHQSTSPLSTNTSVLSWCSEIPRLIQSIQTKTLFLLQTHRWFVYDAICVIT